MLRQRQTCLLIWVFLLVSDEWLSVALNFLSVVLPHMKMERECCICFHGVSKVGKDKWGLRIIQGRIPRWEVLISLHSALSLCGIWCVCMLGQVHAAPRLAWVPSCHSQKYLLYHAYSYMLKDQKLHGLVVFLFTYWLDCWGFSLLKGLSVLL